MNKRIFNAIWSVAIVVFLSSLIFIMGVSYSYFSRIQAKQLKIETELASQGVEMGGMSYLKKINSKEYRVTWINSDGKVLFDNAINKNKMENHLKRKEIKEAIKNGYGEFVFLARYQINNYILQKDYQMIQYCDCQLFRCQYGRCYLDLHSQSVLLF